MFYLPDNRFSPNILSAIKEQLFQYQQKICLAGEGIKVFKIEVIFSKITSLHF